MVAAPHGLPRLAKSFDSALKPTKKSMMGLQHQAYGRHLLVVVVQLWTRYVWPYVRIAFGGDKRSAALFRVALAITVLGDVVDRAHDLSAHYTDAGVLPRRVALDKFTNVTWLSLHMWGGSWWAVVITFALHLAAAAAMLVGWHSRKAALAVWIMTTSLQVRNILVLHSGDVLLRLSLFWALFLPLGDVFSLDAAFSNDDKAETETIEAATSEERDRELERKEANDDHNGTMTTTIADTISRRRLTRYAFINAGTLAVLLQVGLMYFTSVYHKTSDQWSVTGTATYFALQLDYFRMPMADFMLAALHPHLLPYFTFAVYYWEWLGSFLMVFPYKTGFMRTFGVAGYMFMHLGFGLCMRLATFFWAAEAALCVLLPGWFWDEFLFKYVLRKTPQRTRFELFYTKRSLFRFYERFARVVGAFCLFPETEVKPLDELRLDIDDGDDGDEDYDGEAGIGHKSVDEGRAGSHSSGGRVHSFADLVDASLVTVDHLGHVHQDFRAVVSLCYASPVLWPLGWLLTRITDSSALSRCFVLFGFCIDVVVEACLHFALGRRLNELRRDVKMKRAADREAKANGSLSGEHAKAAWKRSALRNKQSRFSIRHLFTLRTMSRLLRNLFCLWLVYFVFGWTMNNIGVSHWVPRHNVRWLAYTLHIDQAWNMFSPHPPDTSWWYIIEGSLVNEETVEMHRDRGMFEWKGGPLHDWSPPASLPDTIGNHRWFKFYEQVNDHSENAVIRLYWGRYICREWNKRHDYYERIYEFKIWWLSRRVALDGTHAYQPKQLLWHHVCYDTKPSPPPPRPAVAS